MKPYYEQDGITIYHGDCRELAPRLGRFDLLLTDPPYGIGMASNPVRQAHVKMDWDSAAPEPWVIAMCVSMAEQAIVWGGNYFGLPPAQCFLVWDKIQPQDFSLAMCEQAWTNLKMPAKVFRKSVLSYAKSHPTEKPEALMAWCIGFADPCATVLDPFMGSGTTLVAAKRLGRKAVGIEREQKYCDVAVSRLAQGALFNAEQTA